jgi:phosphoadenosine phosphosulfate reductase
VTTVSVYQLTLDGKDKLHKTLDRICEFEPKEGYYLAFSGGKDSQTVYHLLKMAGVKFDAHFNLTTVDPPELVRFVKQNYPDVEIIRPPRTMWQLIVSNGPPTRIFRFCCRELKETGGVVGFVARVYVGRNQPKEPSGE